MSARDIKTFDAPRAHLGEGPFYCPARDTAWWVDILERKLFEAPMAGGPVLVHTLPFMASKIAAIDPDHQLLAAEDGLYVRTVTDGALSRHVPLEGDDRRTRANDGRVHPCGAMWISTMGRGAEPGLGTIYHVRGAEVRRLYAGLTIPNAICFSPDGATAYFVDTAAHVLQRVPVDPATGLPTGEPAPFYDHRGGEGGIDGAVVDAEGVVWSARWGGGCLDAYAPDGRRLRSVPLPVRQPSCPTFAGAGLDHLLVTSAYEGMDAAARSADPNHGLTFLVAIGSVGVLEPQFRLSEV